MAKRLFNFINIKNDETGKTVSKGHRSHLVATEKMHKLVRKTGQQHSVVDDFGTYAVGKPKTPRIPNGRMVPARIRYKGKTYPGKVKRVNGRVKIFVTPQVARKINPQTKFYETIAQGIGKVYQGSSKTLALAAGKKHAKAGRYTDVYCNGEVIKQFQHYTGKATTPKKNGRHKR